MLLFRFRCPKGKYLSIPALYKHKKCLRWLSNGALTKNIKFKEKNCTTVEEPASVFHGI